MARPVPARTRLAAQHVGPHLTAWRKLQGLTADQVAERAGISRGTLRRLENGETGFGGPFVKPAGLRRLRPPGTAIPCPTHENPIRPGGPVPQSGRASARIASSLPLEPQSLRRRQSRPEGLPGPARGQPGRTGTRRRRTGRAVRGRCLAGRRLAPLTRRPLRRAPCGVGRSSGSSRGAGHEVGGTPRRPGHARPRGCRTRLGSASSARARPRSVS